MLTGSKPQRAVREPAHVFRRARRLMAQVLHVILGMPSNKEDENMGYEQTAESVLNTLRLDNNGVLTLPVDPVAVARRFGINVYSSDLRNDVAGILSKLGHDEGVDMFLNRNHGPTRQRFTAAHELGHYFHNATGPDHDSFYFERADLARCGTDQDEIYANGFAACLLMPRPEVRDLVAEGYGIVELANAFHVSPDAMNYRLRNLSLDVRH